MSVNITKNETIRKYMTLGMILNEVLRPIKLLNLTSSHQKIQGIEKPSMTSPRRNFVTVTKYVTFYRTTNQIPSIDQ